MDHGDNTVSNSLCIGQTFQDDQAGAFSTPIAIRRSVKGLAAPIRRQHMRA